jgi:hypothetical protein
VTLIPKAGSFDRPKEVDDSPVKEITLAARPADNHIRLVVHVEQSSITKTRDQIHLMANGQQAVQLGKWLQKWGKEVQKKV